VSSTVSAALRYLERKTLKAAKVIFESSFGKEASNRVEELARKYPSQGTDVKRRRFTVRTGEDTNKITAWAVGQRIRMERERQGMRQEDLAEQSGIRRPNIARLEAGKHLPSVATLQKIARALRLDMSGLMVAPISTEQDMLEFREMAEMGIQEWEKTLKKEDRRK